MYYPPLSWYEQEGQWHRARIESLPRPLWFCVSSRWRLDNKDNLDDLTGQYISS